MAPLLLALAIMALLVASSSALASQEQVKDGGFEEESSAWAFEGGAKRCEANTSCGPESAASGAFYAATPTFTSESPMAGAVPDGTITQLVPVPEIPATLSFKLREITELGTLSMQLQVKYAGEVIDEVTAAAGETFQPETASIPAPLAGSSPRPLVFSVTCFNFTVNTGHCPRFDFDDISLMTGASSTPPPGGGTGGSGGGSADTTPPETTLGSFKKTVTVKKKGARGKVKLRFSSEPGARFECKLDRGGYSSCASPRTLELKPGKHVFMVRAVDAAGNADPTPAKATIRVKVA